jgi:CPA2 family monovalent cation:H+ antiporter-2
MHDLSVLITFAGGLAAALVLGLVALRMKLSPIVGYLLAGILVGPFTPGFVADRAVAEQFAQIGVILLLFGIGLRFDLRELAAVWRVAVPGALIQSTLSTVALAFLLRLLGWQWISGMILGMAISVASTVVMALVLGERRDLHATIGYIAIGWTVVEDLLTVALLILLPIFFGHGGNANQAAGGALAIAGLKVLGLGATVVVLGLWVIPWALEKVERTRSRELFTLAVLVVAVGIAVGSSKIFGVSIELGAFLAGLAVGRSEFAARAAGDAVPMRDAFAVLFFVSVGMLFEPRSLAESPLVIASVLGVVIIVKPLAAVLTVRALGKPMSMAIPIGAAFSQVGEFSFILGTLARSLGLINDAGWNALVAASILSIALNPSIYGWARHLSRNRTEEAPIPAGPRPQVDPNRCIVVGHGPVGTIVYQLLKQRGINVTVIDLNLQTVRRLRSHGATVVYGDAFRRESLEQAAAATAGTLILTADVEDGAEIVRQARLLNPAIRILARCSHIRDAGALRSAGAEVVAAGEAEVGVALAEAVAVGDDMGPAAATEYRKSVRQSLYGLRDRTPLNAGDR